MTGGTPVPTTARLGSSTGCRLSAILRAQFRIDVSYRRQIHRARPRVELAEHRIATRFGLKTRNAAGGIVQVAEHDRVRRTDLLARGLDVAVGDGTARF